VRKQRAPRQYLRWEDWETGCVDRVAREYVEGMFESYTDAVTVCTSRIDEGWRLRRRKRGFAGVRNRAGVGARLRDRLRAAGHKPEVRSPRLTEVEQKYIPGFFDKRFASTPTQEPMSLGDAARLLRTRLKVRGVERSVPACAAMLGQERRRREIAAIEELSRGREWLGVDLRSLRQYAPETGAKKRRRGERVKRPAKTWRAWQEWEREVLDDVARRHMKGEFGTLRDAVGFCYASLEAGRRRRHRGPVRREPRTRSGVGAQLFVRLVRMGYRPKLQAPRWGPREMKILHGVLDRHVRAQRRASPPGVDDAAVVVRAKLKAAGFRRTLPACRNRIRIALSQREEAVMQELGVGIPTGRSDRSA
jgi:hypothetical protein